MAGDAGGETGRAVRSRPALAWQMSRVPFLLVLAVTLFFALYAVPPVPSVLSHLSRTDLLFHFLAFAACAAAAPQRASRPLLWPFLLILLAGSIELVQLALDGRSASMSDFVAGVAGIGSGRLLGQTLVRAGERLARGRR